MTGSMMERLEENKLLITQSPVLNLLHAHGESPMERCSSWLNPFANRTRFTPSVRKVASHLITLKNVCCCFHPNNIRRVGKAERAHRNVGKFLQTELTPLTILTPLAFAPCDRATTRMTPEFAGGGVPNSKPCKAFRHIATKQSLQHKLKYLCENI